MIFLLTAIGLSLGGSSTVHIYTQTIHRTTQITTSKMTLLYLRTFERVAHYLKYLRTVGYQNTFLLTIVMDDLF
jgi:uncharacterized integral membrane protein